MEVLKEGYRIPFSRTPLLAPWPLLFDSYGLKSLKNLVLEKEIAKLLELGAVERVLSSDPGFYNRIFLVQKTSGSWRPIIDLKCLNRHVTKTRFRMETVQSVLSAVRRNDWMVSIDLKDAYLQVPIHPESRKFLRFSSRGEIFQFRTLCFGLSTAPQVFTRVMAPVAKILHSMGVRLMRYLDDWLVQASSKEACIRARDMVLDLCKELGIIINKEKSSLIPSQEAIYLGMKIDSMTLRASPTITRQENLLSLIEEFLSSREQQASLWRRLLGHLSSMTQLIPGGRLRMRALQTNLRDQWDFKNESTRITWGKEAQQDLSWWQEEGRLARGCPLQSIPPDLAFWSDASDKGWGAHISSQFSNQYATGLWSEEERELSINMREIRAARLGLQSFQEIVQDKVIALFSDNTTTVAYLRNQGGTHSRSLNREAQGILRWAESNGVTIRPQFLLGSKNVVADSLSRPNQVQGSEWTLCQEIVNRLTRKWPTLIDLFATSLNYRLPVYFAPLQDPMCVGTDALLQIWDDLQAYAFPPFSLIRRVLNKVRLSRRLQLTLIAPFWPQKEWFPDLLEVLMEPPLRLPERRDLLRQPHFHRFHLGLQSLRLHAWRLSSGSPGMRASHLGWLDSYR